MNKSLTFLHNYNGVSILQFVLAVLFEWAASDYHFNYYLDCASGKAAKQEKCIIF